jgi:hypothetical protein
VQPGRGARDGQAAERLHHQYVERERELTIPNQMPYVVSKGGDQPADQGHVAEPGRRTASASTAIGPGTILTELAKHAVMASPEARHTILSRTPLGRCGEPEESGRRSPPSWPATTPAT